MIPVAKYTIHSVVLTCPHCGAIVPNIVNGSEVTDISGLMFLEDPSTCKGNDVQPGCGRPFRLSATLQELTYSTRQAVAAFEVLKKELMGATSSVQPLEEKEGRMFDLSFSEEFFMGGEESFDSPPERSDRPTTVFQALISMPPDEWRDYCEKILHVDPNSESALGEALDKVREVNTCRSLSSPVEVLLDEDWNWSVRVYDDRPA